VKALSGAGLRSDERIDVAPLLRPRIAQQVGANEAVFAGCGGTVLLNELIANIGVQRDVEWLNLLPESLGLRREFVRGHVVIAAPHGSHVFEAEFARTLILEGNKSFETLAHRCADCCPSSPDVFQ